jgi:hypothetical protein
MTGRKLSRDAGRKSRRLEVKNVLFCMVLLTLFLCPRIATAEDAAAGGPAPEVSLTLRTLAPEYGLDEVRRGAVGFLASIENRGDAAVNVAHPTACFPAVLREGESFHVSERHGKSEIVLTVQRPDGSVVVLRDGLHFFEPGNIPLLTVPPGGSKDFSLGWFFLSSRMTWEDSRLAERLFLESGSFRASLLFRNSFPKAAVYDSATKRTDFMDVWTGELRSNEVALEVR